MYEPHIIIALFVLYTAMLAIWFPSGRIADMEQNIKTAKREMAKIKKQMDTLVETDIFVLKADWIRIQKKKNENILQKLRDTDGILEDLDQSTREIERKVKKGQAIFRHLKAFVNDQNEKNDQFKQDVDQLYQMYNRIQEERGNGYRSHQERQNERQRDVAKKPDIVVRVINKAIDFALLAVAKIGETVGKAIACEVIKLIF